MLGKDKFEHDLPWVLEYGIGVLRHSLKIGDCAGASMLDVRVTCWRSTGTRG